ncbi:MAG: SMI1/KNR4 family protein [Microscillaceae bacterium]|nr:SMI1/KNR4 family protein [Microscillaceae bacterium]
MSISTLQKAWQGLQAWYEKHQPFILAGFNEGGTVAEIQVLEQEIGFALPEGLRALLLANNGTDGFVLFDGREVCRLLSINEIKEEFKMQQMSTEGQAEIARQLKIPYHPQRIPVLLYPTGDLAYWLPDSGQLTYIAEDGDGYKVFESLEIFLTQLNGRLEKGRYQLDDYGNIRKVEVQEIWRGIRKILDQFLAHRGELFHKGITAKAQKQLQKTIQARFPVFRDLAYEDLPESLRLTLKANDGQVSDFCLFFYEGQSYCLLSSAQMIEMLLEAPGQEKLILPILKNGPKILGIDILTERVYVYPDQALPLDWMDFLLGYWAALQNRQFGVGDHSLYFKTDK